MTRLTGELSAQDTMAANYVFHQLNLIRALNTTNPSKLQLPPIIIK